jgi:hypothetical protein
MGKIIALVVLVLLLVPRLRKTLGKVGDSPISKGK